MTLRLIMASTQFCVWTKVNIEPGISMMLVMYPSPLVLVSSTRAVFVGDTVFNFIGMIEIRSEDFPYLLSEILSDKMLRMFQLSFASHLKHRKPFTTY